MSDVFRRFAHAVSTQAGSPWATIAAFCVVAVWLVTGPLFDYSDHWQLLINTGTTIITFLMVFLIQSAQNRDGKAIHLKLDELIRGVQGARTRLVSLEECSDEELAHLQAEFQRLRHRLGNGRRADSVTAAEPRGGPSPAAGRPERGSHAP
jgi:low affinity Fe/Cu permease